MKTAVRVGILGLATVLVLGGAASAGEVCWLPYGGVNNITTECLVGDTWASDPYWFHQIDDSATDNIVWKESIVFYTHPYGQSYFDSTRPANKNHTEWTLSVHNPTAQDYTTTGAYVTLTFFDPSGTRITSSSILNTSPSPAWIWWDSTPGSECFRMSVPALSTRAINDVDLFQSEIALGFTAKVESEYTDGYGEGGDIEASWRMAFNHRYRIATGDVTASFSDSYHQLAQGYVLPSMRLYDGVSNPWLVLPYWKEHCNVFLSPQWTTFVHVMNADDYDLDITASVYGLDGTLLKSHTFEDIAPAGRVGFSASQFLETGDPQEGYLEVTSVQSASPGTDGKILGIANLVNMTIGYNDFPTLWSWQYSNVSHVLQVKSE